MSMDLSNLDPKDFSESDKRELQQTLSNEMQKAKLQESMDPSLRKAHLVDLGFPKQLSILLRTPAGRNASREQ